MAKINRTLHFRGSQFAYKVKGSGRAILLIHGFLGTQEVWSTYFDRLSKNFKVISLDLPGHGKSQNLGYVHEMGLMANLLFALLKELNVRKVVIAGHSLGGYVGLAFAELYPDHLLGLILVWKLLPNLAVKDVATFRLVHLRVYHRRLVCARIWIITPLLKEKRHASTDTLVTQRTRPIWMHRTCVFAALAPADHPMDAGHSPEAICAVVAGIMQINKLKQRLATQEANLSGYVDQCWYAFFGTFLIFDCCADPDV